MIMDKIITIAVPTYNMEEYLERCLESLLIEDYSLLMNIEVLVINDGSKDCSLKIAHTYETRFPEVFRVIDKANGNWGSCINRAGGTADRMRGAGADGLSTVTRTPSSGSGCTTCAGFGVSLILVAATARRRARAA